jgi:dihydroorotate dehydrogenase (fumarate)
MDLTTTYLGRTLPHPFMPGASPLADELDTVRRLEDAGAAAIVLRSLFEEQITREQMAAVLHQEAHDESFAEAMSFFPNPDAFVLGPEEYLKHLQRVKETVGLPVFASLNGTTSGGWLEYARLMEQAGADGLELNVFHVPTDLEIPGTTLERETLAMVREVKQGLRIPVAVKLSPFFTAFAHFAHELDEAGADGLILFNRFYEPDINTVDLEVRRELHLSDSTELGLRLRWLAILSGRIKASLAVTGGVHTPLDAVKSIMAGAHAVQMVSALIVNGPIRLQEIVDGVATWMEENEWSSLSEMRGNMSLQRVPDPRMYERANYMWMLQGWGRM